MTPKAILGRNKKKKNTGRDSCSHQKKMGNGKGITEGENKESLVEKLFKYQLENIYFPSISGQ